MLSQKKPHLPTTARPIGAEEETQHQDGEPHEAPESRHYAAPRRDVHDHSRRDGREEEAGDVVHAVPGGGDSPDEEERHDELAVQPLMLQDDTEAARASSDEYRTFDSLLLRGLGQGPELCLVRQAFPENGRRLDKEDGVHVEVCAGFVEEALDEVGVVEEAG